MTELSILHFNDVYRVTPQKLSSSSSETIDVTQFASLLESVRDRWTSRSDGKKDGLCLFSGDVFAPSVESTVSRGSHMVPVMNILEPDVSLTGNHDFDFGYPHLSKLIQDTTFPWVLSNIFDENTGKVPEHLYPFRVLERNGVRAGIIGLVEKEWIQTVSSWPDNFKYNDMAEVGKDLSKRLRDPNGEHKCDIIIALTHARVPNDISLAKALYACSPSAQRNASIADQHGVDIILGGHDHLYYVSKGTEQWEGYDLDQKVLGAEKDEGDVLVVKSGTDFRDLSEFTLKLSDTPEGSVRRKVISGIQGKYHQTRSDLPSHVGLKKTLESLLSDVSESLKAPICITEVELNLHSDIIRTRECAAPNWFADILRHTYDDALSSNGERAGADGVFICAGTLRGDSVYAPGHVTLGNIMEILPFEDPVVVLELDGAAIWDALESSLSTWPAQEGRFPVISGFRVSWDSKRPAGQRVLGVWLIPESNTTTPANGESKPSNEEGVPIPRTRDGRKYAVVTREYMAQGHDGYDAMRGKTYLIDEESGMIMSNVVRKYLLGSRFVNRMARLKEKEGGAPSKSNADSKGDTGARRHLHHKTSHIIDREVHHRIVAQKWQRVAQAATQTIQKLHHHPHKRVRDHLGVSGREHMSGVDCYDGSRARKGEGSAPSQQDEDGSKDHTEDLLVVHPEVDGRLKDEAGAAA